MFTQWCLSTWLPFLFWIKNYGRCINKSYKMNKEKHFSFVSSLHLTCVCMVVILIPWFVLYKLDILPWTCKSVLYTWEWYVSVIIESKWSFMCLPSYNFSWPNRSFPKIIIFTFANTTLIAASLANICLEPVGCFYCLIYLFMKPQTCLWILIITVKFLLQFHV